MQIKSGLTDPDPDLLFVNKVPEFNLKSCFVEPSFELKSFAMFLIYCQVQIRRLS
jgi:hypothetical protein